MAKEKPYHHGNLAAELLRIACDTLAEGGAASLTLRGVAERAGVTAAAVYRHFADKDALLAAVAEDGYRQLVTQFEAAMGHNTPSPRDQLRGLGRAYIQFAAENPHLHSVMFGPRAKHTKENDRLQVIANQSFSLLQQAVLRCLGPSISEQQLMQTSLALWSLVHGYAILARDGHFAQIPAEYSLPPDEMLQALLPFAQPPAAQKEGEEGGRLGEELI